MSDRLATLHALADLWLKTTEEGAAQGKLPRVLAIRLLGERLKALPYSFRAVELAPLLPVLEEAKAKRWFTFLLYPVGDE